MLALGANFAWAKVGFTTMTLPVDSLTDWLAHEILSSSATWDGKASSGILLSPDWLNLTLFANLLLALSVLLWSVMMHID